MQVWSRKIGPDHSPKFISKIKFEDKYGDHLIVGCEANNKNDAESGASFCGIKYFQINYDIIIKDINKKELEELKFAIKDLREANDELWKCHIETVKELNKLKDMRIIEKVDSVST